jgi:type IV pilus biogenesis protein CpaD/CtpE
VIAAKDELGLELLRLDEAIGFDEKGKLSADHQDILAEVAAWLAANPDVVQLKVEVHGPIENKRVRQKRTKAMAQQVVDALVQSGVATERVVAVEGRAAKDGPVEVSLRVVRPAEPDVVVEEKPE